MTTLQEINALIDWFPFLLVAVGAVFGAMIGSFLNVVIYRLPKADEWDLEQAKAAVIAEHKGEEFPDPGANPYQVSGGRSYCPHCNHAIRWYENIPVLSWIGLRGKCSQCKGAISFQYPAVELATAALFAAAFSQFPSGITPVWALSLGLVLTALACGVANAGIDFKTLTLSTALTQIILWTGFAHSTIQSPAHIWTVTPQASVLGAATAWAILAGTRWLWLKLRGIDAMGGGDIILLAAIGAWLGVAGVVATLGLACLTGIAHGVFQRIRHGVVHRGDGTPAGAFPFGPHLILGWMVLLLFPGILQSVGAFLTGA